MKRIQILNVGFLILKRVLAVKISEYQIRGNSQFRYIFYRSAIIEKAVFVVVNVNNEKNILKLNKITTLLSCNFER